MNKIILTLSIVIIILLLKKKKNNHTKHLVLAVYNENITWVKKEIPKFNFIFVYIKNESRINELKELFKNDNNVLVISMNNIGSCDHVYLYHIINNYNNLADMNTFSKGTEPLIKYNKFPDNKYVNKLLGIFNTNDLKKFSLSDYKFTNNKDAKFEFKKSKYNNLEEYLIDKFGKIFTNTLLKYSSSIFTFTCFEKTIYSFKGYFTVSKKKIIQYKRKLYEKLIEFETKGPNREIDHFHERIWGILFTNTYFQI